MSLSALRGHFLQQGLFGKKYYCKVSIGKLGSKDFSIYYKATSQSEFN